LPGAGTVFLSALGTYTHTGNLILNAGTMQADAALASAAIQVNAGTTLRGTGSVPNIIANAGLIDPGAGAATAGRLTVTQNLAMSSAATLRVDLRGTGFRGSDQLRVTDVVNLGNPALAVALSFNSAVGDSFRIIDNLGTDAVVGRFAGLPNDGSTFQVAGPDGQLRTFDIDYTGGDGNDVVIRHVNTGTMAPGIAVTPTAINEGQVVHLTGRLVDPDPGDRLTLVVDWGDGSSPQTFRPGTRDFSIPHRYRDNPAGADHYVIHASWFDNHGGGNSRDLHVAVENAAPEVFAGGDVLLRGNQPLTRLGRFTDPGADHWTATVNYGDGAGPQTLALSPSKHFVLHHHYAEPGTYTVTVTVQDDDGDVGTTTFEVQVSGRAALPWDRDAADDWFALLGRKKRR
jgi:hypothetical protein